MRDGSVPSLASLGPARHGQGLFAHNVSVQGPTLPTLDVAGSASQWRDQGRPTFQRMATFSWKLRVREIPRSFNVEQALDPTLSSATLSPFRRIAFRRFASGNRPSLTASDQRAIEAKQDGSRHCSRHWVRTKSTPHCSPPCAVAASTQAIDLPRQKSRASEVRAMRADC